MEIFTEAEKLWLKEIESKRSEYWNISPETAHFIFEKILELDVKVALEIGMSNGYSAIWIAKALEKTEGHLYSVESNQPRFDLARDNFEKFGVSDRITMVKGHAPEIFAEANWYKDNLFDLVFLDATKMEYLSYFQGIWKKVKKDGVVIADNMQSHAEQLRSFLDYVMKQSDLQAKAISLGSGLLMIQKTS